MGKRYSGRVGRVVGFAWGTCWLAIGTAAVVVIGDGLIRIVVVFYRSSPTPQTTTGTPLQQSV